MKVTYIEHSGFCVELEDVVLVFDYFRGTLPVFQKDKNIYVFASHVHFDHFQKEIFKWADMYPHITYILSDDISCDEDGLRVIYTSPDKNFHADGLHIRTLKSTDEGVAFFVTVHGKVIYHAGDLNWWHWEEESDVYNKYMKKMYQAAIKKIEGEHIDAAFVPLDPRQGEYYYLGMDWFLRNTDTTAAFPMHMNGDYELCGRFLQNPLTEAYRDRFIRISHAGQNFELSI